jgi:hypothetical protein
MDRVISLYRHLACSSFFTFQRSLCIQTNYPYLVGLLVWHYLISCAVCFVEVVIRRSSLGLRWLRFIPSPLLLVLLFLLLLGSSIHLVMWVARSGHKSNKIQWFIACLHRLFGLLITKRLVSSLNRILVDRQSMIDKKSFHSSMNLLQVYQPLLILFQEKSSHKAMH